jgi:hypothetical protein
MVHESRILAHAKRDYFTKDGVEVKIERSRASEPGQNLKNGFAEGTPLFPLFPSVQIFLCFLL